MKIMTAVLMLFVTGVAQAYEVDGNPDRKISFGLNYDHMGTKSDYTFGSTKISDFTKVSENLFFADVRIPLASVLTFSIRGGYLNMTNDIFTGEVTKTSGYDIGFGLRFYLQ